MAIRSPFIDVDLSSSALCEVVHNVFQYDHGLSLRITGSGGRILQVHYAVEGIAAVVKDIPVTSGDTVLSSIPDVLLVQPDPLYAYVYVEESEFGLTIHSLKIIITPRPRPAGPEYTPEQIAYFDRLIGELNTILQDADVELIAQLNELVERAEAIVDSDRIALRHDTEAGWNTRAVFVPSAGELIIYDADATYDSARFKVGDGTTTVANLPFSPQFESVDVDLTHLNATNLTSGTVNPARLPIATQQTAGAMSAADKQKLDGIAAGATAYTPPTYTAHESGLYKVTVNQYGHVSGADAVTKSDITALGIPAQDTVYTLEPATASVLGGIKVGNGLSVGQDGTLSADAQTFTLTPATSSALGGVKIGTGVSVAADGTISVDGQAPTAISGDIITSGTVAAARIDNLPASKITSGTLESARIPDLSGTYALKSDIVGVYRYKGSVATVSALPSFGVTQGDVYDVQAGGMNYAWNGSAWDALGSILTISSITDSEIDQILAT